MPLTRFNLRFDLRPGHRRALAAGATVAVVAVVAVNVMHIAPLPFGEPSMAPGVEPHADLERDRPAAPESPEPAPGPSPASVDDSAGAVTEPPPPLSTTAASPIARDSSVPEGRPRGGGGFGGMAGTSSVAGSADRMRAAQSLESGVEGAPRPIDRSKGVGQKREPALFAMIRGLSIDTEPLDVRGRASGRDRFADVDANPVKSVAEAPVSTFSIDVDTASYGFMRASLGQGTLPPHDAVRIEELINYFPYDHAGPESRDPPFAASVSLMPAPWNEATRLMHIAIRGYRLGSQARPRANLVFLIDTSGSMDAPNRLPLLLNSFRLLLEALEPDDTVAIVTYAGSAGVALEPTPAAERTTILAGLDRLVADGSTAGAEGIRQAYRLAEQGFAPDGINRVILATDGDFNVGITDDETLRSYIERKRSGGVFLSVLGFGTGNYNDALMQTLAQSGNGNASYIDTLSEARKVLVEEATSTLFPIARDVKIQVEFNPALVSEYRLIGYETRRLAREDFTNDKVDAGDIGAGHTVTAIYELTPAGSGAERIEPLRYRSEAAASRPVFPGADFEDEYAFLKIRYKPPGEDASRLITRPVTRADEVEQVGAAPQEARFAAAVAGFGQLLRGGRYTGDYGYDDVLALAQDARGEDRFGYRAEFVTLVRLAKSIASVQAQ